MITSDTAAKASPSSDFHRGDSLCGVLVLDKPAGWTSHDAVNKMRRIAGTKKIGHLGTLDPLATGVLPLVIGKATRLAQFFTKDRKSYEAVIRFGHSTFTYDREGDATSETRDITLSADEMRPLLERFRGKLSQMPPPVSAKKIDGVPAYKLARQAKPVELNPVDIEVFSLEVLDMNGPDLRIAIECSAGTYVRSIAHDLGQALGCGAYVQELRRTRSGDFTLPEARTLEDLAALAADGNFEKALIGGPNLLPQFPNEVVDAITEAQIRQGRDFRTSPFRVTRDSKYVKALTREGHLLAIGEFVLPNLYHPALVLN
jgi:tRNA pseudouridine55 synthase